MAELYDVKIKNIRIGLKISPGLDLVSCSLGTNYIYSFRFLSKLS